MSDMTLNDKFDNAFRVLNSNRTRDEKLSLFLDDLIKEAEKIKKTREVILCGATPFAKTVLNNREMLFDNDVRLEIEDFIDERTNVRGGAVCILCSRPNIEKHLAKLEKIKDINIVSYQLLLLLEPRFSTNPYAYQYEKIIKQIEDIVDFAEEYYSIYQNLGDEKSKEIFMKMILFRLTYDCGLHKENATKYPHYFDADILCLDDAEIFVDCGGYIGDTLVEFKKVTNNHFKKYYLFEPDDKLIAIAKEKGDERVAYINKGVWKNDAKLYFKRQTADGNGTFIEGEAGDREVEVPVTNLDINIDEATFIKMDIEGFELMALEGARNLIKKCHPKLAICVYHKYEDFRELYNYINLLGRYKIYLRAEMNNIDTELYYLCIPQEI